VNGCERFMVLFYLVVIAIKMLNNALYFSTGIVTSLGINFET